MDSTERMDPRERIARRLMQIGRTVAGDRGARAANGISQAIGCGRIEYCDIPTCPYCADVITR